MESDLSFWTSAITISRIDGTSTSIDPFGDPVRNERLIVEEFKLRRALGDRARVDGVAALTWLKELCYRIIVAWLAADQSEDARERLERHGRFVRGTPRSDRDIFEDGIIAILAQHSGLLTTRDRDRIAGPMWYGFRHYIPPALLTGFNHQYPCRKKEVKDWRERIEPALEDWVVEHRVRAEGSDLDAFRNGYPTRINRRVAKLQVKLRQADEEWD